MMLNRLACDNAWSSVTLCEPFMNFADHRSSTPDVAPVDVEPTEPVPPVVVAGSDVVAGSGVVVAVVVAGSLAVVPGSLVVVPGSLVVVPGSLWSGQPW